MGSMTIYALGYSLELSSLDLPGMLFWSKIGYLGICSFPTLFLIFVLQFTGNDKWLTRANILLLSLVPGLLLVAKLTDDYFHLVYSSVWVDTSGPIPLLGYTRGPVYPFALYAIFPVGLGIILLWRKRQNTPSFYRKQATFMVACVFIPMLVFLFYMSGLQPFPGLTFLDWNVFMYTLWGIGLGWIVFRYQLFNLAPVARDVLIEHMDDGMLVLDNAARLVDANPAALKIMGWARAPIGQPASQVFSTWDELHDAFPMDRPGDPVKAEIRHNGKDEKVFFDVSITTLRDGEGQDWGQLVVFHDISEHKRAEENQNNFHRYFNMGAVGMCILSPEKQWLEVNGRLCQMLGYSPVELKQLTWTELTHPADLEAEITLLNDILNNRRDSYQQDKRFIRKDGGVIYTSTYISCYRNPDESTCYFMASMVDISEQKQAQEALLKLTTIEERQRLSRDLHDSVNQSLNGIMLFSETLLAALDKNQAGRARQIAERMQESARQALKETRLMLYELQPSNETRGKNFIQDLETRLLTVERRSGVKAQIIQEGSIENLPQKWRENLFWMTIEALNNTLKHAQARNIQIIIRVFPLEPRDDIPQHLELEIVDDGKGFDTTILKLGGLGLKNMRERANLLGGELTIHSVPGQGTSISFGADIEE